MTDGSADDLLARARQARQAWLDGNCMQDELLEDAGEAFTGLDTLLSSGGPLPAAWLPAIERPVQDIFSTAPHRDTPGLRVCVTCGETIRRVSAEDGIDPEDRDYYAWVGADGGGPFCDGPAVHSPRSESALPRRVPGVTLPGGPGHPGGGKVP